VISLVTNKVFLSILCKVRDNIQGEEIPEHAFARRQRMAISILHPCQIAVSSYDPSRSSADLKRCEFGPMVLAAGDILWLNAGRIGPIEKTAIQYTTFVTTTRIVKPNSF